MSDNRPVIRLLALAGSTDPRSYARAVVSGLWQSLPAATEMDSIDLEDLPFFSEQAEVSHYHLAVRRLRRAIAQADGLVIVTPEHNASVPALLKNALDWASTPYFSSALSGKACALVGVSSTTGGGRRALRHLREVLVASDAIPLEGSVTIGSAESRIAADGTITDTRTRQSLSSLLLHVRETIRSDYYAVPPPRGPSVVSHLESA